MFSNQRPRRPGIQACGSLVLLTGLLVTGGVTWVRQLGFLEGNELSAYDALLRMRPDDARDDRLLVVGITEEDIQQRQEYPLKDSTVATLLQTLRAYGPRVTVLDIARDVPQGDGREALMAELQASDRIIAGCVLSSQTEPGIPPPPGVAPDQVGFADFPIDLQGIVRRSILISTPAPTDSPLGNTHLCNEADPENELLSLALLSALIYLEDEGIPIDQTANGELQLGSVVVPRLSEQASGYAQNGATDYQVMLNYRARENAIPMVSLTDVLEGNVNPNWIENRLVLIGYTSTAANDYFFTPYSGQLDGGDISMPGVMLHAQSASQLISAVLDGRSLIWYWPLGIEVIWILGWAIIGGTPGVYLRKTGQFVLAEAAITGALLAACYGLFLSGGWVPLTPALLAALVTAMGTVLLDRGDRTGYSQALYEQTRDSIRGVFKPTINVNHAQKAEQVAEIANSAFFKELQQRAKQIREQRQQLTKDK